MTGAGARPQALDLFAGACGGWTLGLHRAGFETVAACEIDPWRRARYAENFPWVHLYADIRDLTAGRLAADGIAAPWLVCGSPPCQDASAANTRGRGVDGERTGLYREWLRLVSELRPAWTCAENVAGLRTRGVDRLLADLESLDYAVWAFVVGAGDIGAPHKRERVWIVARDSRRHVKLESAGFGSKERQRDRNAIVGDVADSSSVGCRERWSEHVGQQGRQDASERSGDHDPDAGSERGLSRPCSAASGDRPGYLGDRAYPDADRAGPEIGSGVRNDIDAQLPPALRVWAGGWSHWNGGLAGLLATAVAERAGDLAHGLSARLSAIERNRRIAAIGDSILPQIAEAIGRAILATEAA